MGDETFRYSRLGSNASEERRENSDENNANEIRNQNNGNEVRNQNDDNEIRNQNDGNEIRNQNNGDEVRNQNDGNEVRNQNDANEETNQNDANKVLQPLRKYLAFTGQYCLFEQPARKNLYKLWQFSLLGLAVVYFVYTLGIWGSSTKECDIAHYFYTYPITWSESVLWEFRWMVTGLLGVFLTNGIWIELFNNKHISLENNRWKNVKYVSWALLGALIFLWVLTILVTLSEIDFKVTRFNALSVFADVLFSLLDRVIVFPLFFLFCITMYILCCMVEEYCEKMEEYEGDENSARDEFRTVKAAIRIAGISFEGYLMVHFLFLLCTFFLGVCACFEQMEVRIAENYTVSMPIYIPHSARLINFFGYGNLTFETHGQHATQAGSLLTASYSQLIQTQGKDATTGINNTLKNQFDDLVQTKWFKKEMRDIVFCTIIRTLESLLLYLVPIALMVRLQNRLRRVYEVIEDSKIKYQKAKEYLFNDVEVIRRMCKYVKTAHGLRIFGYTVPAFETFIIAAFGPFIAVVIQRLLVYTHMKK